jgi:hypothetical protein
MEAQEVLVDMLPRHNRRFIVPPLDPEPAWIPWPADRRLEEYFCFKYPRVVARDNTVRFEGYLLDIPPQPSGSLARARVEVQQRFDGNIAIYRNGTCLVTKLLDDPPDLASTVQGSTTSVTPMTKSLSRWHDRIANPGQTHFRYVPA